MKLAVVRLLCPAVLEVNFYTLHSATVQKTVTFGVFKILVSEM